MSAFAEVRRPARRRRWLSRALLTLLALPVVATPPAIGLWVLASARAPHGTALPPAMRTAPNTRAAGPVQTAGATPVWGQPIHAGSGIAGAGSADGGSGPGFGAAPTAFYRPATGGDGPGQDAAGGVMVYYPDGSASAQAAAGQVAARLQPVLGRATAAPAGTTPPGAVIRYRSDADHAAARSVGSLLGQMGYSWRIAGRSDGTNGTGPAVTVWLPVR